MSYVGFSLRFGKFLAIICFTFYCVSEYQSMCIYKGFSALKNFMRLFWNNNLIIKPVIAQPVHFVNAYIFCIWIMKTISFASDTTVFYYHISLIYIFGKLYKRIIFHAIKNLLYNRRQILKYLWRLIIFHIDGNHTNFPWKYYIMYSKNIAK